MTTSFSSRSGVLLTIIGLHGALLAYAVVSANHVAITPPQIPPVLMAQLITPQVVDKPSPPAPSVPKPPTPKPPVAKPTPPAKVAVKEPTPTPVVASEQAAPATPTVAAAAPPAAASAPAAPATPAPAAAVSAPRFSAAYLNNPPPTYPPLARRMGDEGRVMLRVYVTPEGTAGEVRVHTSSGSSLFDEAALAAVKQWRFVPARQGENPVAAWVQVPIVFKLG